MSRRSHRVGWHRAEFGWRTSPDLYALALLRDVVAILAALPAMPFMATISLSKSRHSSIRRCREKRRRFTSDVTVGGVAAPELAAKLVGRATAGEIEDRCRSEAVLAAHKPGHHSRELIDLEEAPAWYAV
jgi:hypothetical protein